MLTNISKQLKSDKQRKRLKICQNWFHKTCLETDTKMLTPPDKKYTFTNQMFYFIFYFSDSEIVIVIWTATGDCYFIK